MEIKASFLSAIVNLLFFKNEISQLDYSKIHEAEL